MILTIKTKCLLAYCYELLTDAKEQTEQGKGNSIFDTDSDVEFIKECGELMCDYAYKNGATKNYLELMSKKHYSLFLKSKTYYDIVIKNYVKHITEVGAGHIPILYSIFMFQELKANGLIGLQLDYYRLNEIIYNTNFFSNKLKPSKHNPDLIVKDRSEINKYNKCIEDTISQVMNCKSSKNKINRKSKRR